MVHKIGIFFKKHKQKAVVKKTNNNQCFLTQLKKSFFKAIRVFRFVKRTLLKSIHNKVAKKQTPHITSASSIFLSDKLVTLCRKKGMQEIKSLKKTYIIIYPPI